ncbi:unnamed protein product [Clavelina lepadiformis]|uniref:Uncharacterized protein n=1 Tax=Clavelina lepadiformis TaxID=159417 RepID=A0ABP0GHR6_CLALP
MESSQECTIDPDDYFHALKVNQSQVPKCTIKKNVLIGYVLPNMPRRYYWKVLWIPCNETLNVWTHLVALIYYMRMLYLYNDSLDLFVQWPLLISLLSSMSVATCSCFAHTFHSRSTFDHCCWMMLDFFGIISYSFCSTVSHFFACSQLSHYARLGFWNIIMFTLNCCIVFTMLCVSKIPYSVTSKRYGNSIRIGGLAYGYIYGILPLLDRFMTVGWDNDAMKYHILSFVYMGLSAYMYASTMPQSISPGSFDIIGHNHQIFHVFSAFAMYYDIIAVHLDLTLPGGPWASLTEQDDHPTLVTVSICGLIVVTWCLFTAAYVAKHIEKSIQAHGEVSCNGFSENVKQS